LEHLPAGLQAQQANIYHRVAQAYVQHDPLAASEWIATLATGPERDASVKTLVNHIAKTDPEAGFIWAATVSDPNDRRNSLSQVVRDWAQANPLAAQQAVDDAVLSAIEKKLLLRTVKQWQSKQSAGAAR
jgi:hypothetical protein